MNSKAILVFRDRPGSSLMSLAEFGVDVHWAANVREAREEFARLRRLDAVVVDVREGVERGLEFCEIVHITRPSVPILFVRSQSRPSLEPHCAHRILDAETTEDDLANEIVVLLENAPAPPDRRTA